MGQKRGDELEGDTIHLPPKRLLRVVRVRGDEAADADGPVLVVEDVS